MIKHRERNDTDGEVVIDEWSYEGNNSGPCTCNENQHRKIRKRFLTHFRLFLFIVRSATYVNLRELVTDDHDFHVVTEFMFNHGLLNRVIIPRKDKKPTEIFQFLETNDATDLPNLLAKELYRNLDKRKFKPSKNWSGILDKLHGDGAVDTTSERTEEDTKKEEKDLEKTIMYWVDYFKKQLNPKMQKWHKDTNSYKLAVS